MRREKKNKKEAPIQSTRKPISELTLEDLAAFPIWEYAIDEEEVERRDETWVRPIPRKTIPKNRYSMTVAAEFRTTDGHTYHGFVGVTTAGGYEACQGVILDAREPYLFVPNPEMAMFEHAKRELAVGLDLTVDTVFPITFILGCHSRASPHCEPAHWDDLLKPAVGL